MSERTRTLRVIAWTLGGALSVLVAAGLALALLFPAERVGTLAAARASAALERDVTVERIRLRLLPVPAVALEGVTVARWRQSEAAERAAAAEPGDDAPLVRIDRVDVRPRLLPLLRGSIVLHALVLDRPRIAIRLEGDASPDLEEARENAPGFWQDADFRIRRIQVRDGTLTYRDVRTGTELRLVGIDQVLRLEGELAGGELARLRLTGRLEAAAFDASVPAHLATPIRNARLAVEHDATLDMRGRGATVERLEVAFQELLLSGSGTVTAWSDPAERRVALHFESGDVDAAALFASLPAGWRAWRRAGEGTARELDVLEGRVRVRADATGRLGNGEVPEIDATVELAGVTLALDGAPVLEGFGGRLAASLDSVVTPGLEGRLLGEPFAARFTVRDLAAPALAAHVSARVDLDRAARLGLLPPGWAAGGVVPVELSVAGDPLDPASLTVNGTAGLAGALVRMPRWPEPLRIESGTLAFGGRDVGGQDLRGAIGGSDVAVDFTMTDWLAFALGDTTVTPQVAFDAYSRRFDFDAVFPPEDPAAPGYTELLFARLTGREVGGRPAGEAAEAAGLRLPELPRVALEGFLHIDELRRQGATFQDVDVQVAGEGGALEVRGADFQLFGGLVRVAGRLDPPLPDGTAPLHLEYRVERTAAEAFLQHYTPFRGRLDGELLLQGTLDMRLDRNALPLAASFGGTGSLALTGGRIVQWPLLAALGEQLGLARLDTIAFRDWRGSFAIDGGRILLQETAIDAGELLARAAGWLDLGGRLEVGATLLLGREWTGRLRGDVASALVSAVADESGRVPVGVVFGGDVLRPTVRLDLSEAGARLADRVRQEAEAEAREVARRVAEEIAERAGAAAGLPVPAPGGGDAGGAVEEARQRVRDAVTDRLRGIFGAPRAEPGAMEPAAPSAGTGGAAEREPPQVEIGDHAREGDARGDTDTADSAVRAAAGAGPGDGGTGAGASGPSTDPAAASGAPGEASPPPAGAVDQAESPAASAPPAP